MDHIFAVLTYMVLIQRNYFLLPRHCERLTGAWQSPFIIARLCRRIPPRKDACLILWKGISYKILLGKIYWRERGETPLHSLDGTDFKKRLNRFFLFQMHS
jgi:hypothetical protein